MMACLIGNDVTKPGGVRCDVLEQLDGVMGVKVTLHMSHQFS